MSLFVHRSQLEALYDRHGSDVFNLSLRVSGSREVAASATRTAFLELGRDHAGGTALLAAARRGSAESSAAAARHEEAGGSPPDVREANARLDPRHREVLALRELVGCSYEEIGRIVGAGEATVAELLWRARLELRDELMGSRINSIAALAKSCRRALALIVMHWDGELHDADERSWLQGHLRTCGKCRLSQEAVRQASAAYRDWPPAATPLGLRESLLDAAESPSASDPAGPPAGGSGRSSRPRPCSPPRGARRGARRSLG